MGAVSKNIKKFSETVFHTEIEKTSLGGRRYQAGKIPHPRFKGTHDRWGRFIIK
jgi:hypothetical protein